MSPAIPGSSMLARKAPSRRFELASKRLNFRSIAQSRHRPHKSGTTHFHVRRDKAALFQRVQAPPGDPLQPEATGAGMEETKCLKPPDSGHEFG